MAATTKKTATKGALVKEFKQKRVAMFMLKEFKHIKELFEWYGGDIETATSTELYRTKCKVEKYIIAEFYYGKRCPLCKSKLSMMEVYYSLLQSNLSGELPWI